MAGIFVLAAVTGLPGKQKASAARESKSGAPHPAPLLAFKPFSLLGFLPQLPPSCPLALPTLQPYTSDLI